MFQINDVCLNFSAEQSNLAFSMIRNLAQFNLTGHPALTINAGYAVAHDHSKLPVGLMIVGKHFDEGTVLAFARAFEEERDRNLPLIKYY